MLFVSEGLCLQVLRSITLAYWVPNGAKSSVSTLFVSEDLCFQVLRSITLTNNRLVT